MINASTNVYFDVYQGGTYRGYYGYKNGTGLGLFSQGAAYVNGVTGTNLQYNGSTKLTTNSTGVDVTGVTTTAGDVVVGGSGDPWITLKSTASGNAAFGRIQWLDSAGTSKAYIGDYTSGTSALIMGAIDGLSFQHNGTTRLATTSTGVDVTGALTVNGAAVGGGGVSSRNLAVGSTARNFYNADSIDTASSPPNLTANYTYAMPITISHTKTITSIGTISYSGVNFMKLGVYDSDPTTGLPSTLLVAPSAVAATNTATTSFTMQAGKLYYVAVLVDVGCGVGGTVRPQFTFGGPNSSSFYNTLVDTTTTYSGGIPATFTPSLSTLNPAAVVRN